MKSAKFKLKKTSGDTSLKVIKPSDLIKEIGKINFGEKKSFKLDLKEFSNKVKIKPTKVQK